MAAVSSCSGSDIWRRLMQATQSKQFSELNEIIIVSLFFSAVFKNTLCATVHICYLMMGAFFSYDNIMKSRRQLASVVKCIKLLKR